MDLPLVDMNGPRLQVYAEITNCDQIWRQLLCSGYASKCGAHSREQFVHAEWLGHVVVRTRVERFDFGLILTFHRQHDDRYLRFRSEPFAQLQPIHVRHSQISNHKVGRPILHNVKGLIAIACCPDCIPPAGQRGFEHARDLPFVIDDENVSSFVAGNHAASFHFLRDNMHIDGWSISQELVYRRKVEILAPPCLGRTAEDNLGNVLVSDDLRNRLNDIRALGAKDLRSNIFGESNILR